MTNSDAPVNNEPDGKGHRLAIAGLLVGILGIAVSLFVPEVRCYVGLDKCSPIPWPTESNKTPDPGKIRFYDAEIDPNSVYPSAFRVLDKPPRVTLIQTSQYGQRHRAVEVTMTGLGISRAQITIKDPADKVILVSAEFVTVQPQMSLVFEIPSDERGDFTFVVHDTQTGLSSQSSIFLTEVELSPKATGVPIGNSPDLRIGTPTGRACDKQGAVVPIIGKQIRMEKTLLEARAPKWVKMALGTGAKDYSGVRDDWGNGYYAIIVKAEKCTGQSIPDFSAHIEGSDTFINFSVPN